ncbi:MAG: bifunctional sugar-1-phosphate nucleotidylyltransferase/acetyltransferase [Candidatus Bathyarchaeota archaeon]
MKAIVLAAGKGVRLEPLTLTKPKNLIPVGGKPILQHLLSTIKASGVKEVLLIIGYGGNQIRRAFGDGSQLGLNIQYERQTRISGTGNALSVAKSYVNNEDFLMVYGDLYIETSVVVKVLTAYRKKKANFMAVAEAERVEDFGLVKIQKSGKILDLLEKPKQIKTPNLVNAGVCIFSPRIFEKIAKTEKSPRGEIEITDAIRLMVKSGENFYAVKVNKESWMDIGRPWDLLTANEHFLKRMKPASKGIVEKGAHLTGKICIEKDVVVKAGSYIEGPVLICQGSKIGPNCYLRPYTTIGRNVKIGNGCEIKNSIIMDGTRIPHLSYVGDSIIGENCNLGAGTIVGNIRFDDKSVKVKIKDEVVDSKRRKLGVIIGDNVKTGINVSFMPGLKVGPNCHIGANVVVYRDISSNVKVSLKQNLVFEKLEK